MLNLIREFCPSPSSAGLGAMWGLIAFCLAGWLASACRRRGLRAGDTRKMFHFCIFNAAALLRWQAEVGAVMIFGSVVAIGVFLVCWRGPGNWIFEALARPSDLPRQRLHVIVPLLCTAFGGVFAQLIAGRLALVAYLIGGWGDAVGEPIGIRYGYHRYRVPSLGGVPATRSWEGSLAVFLASTVAAGMGLILVGQTGIAVLGVALILGLATTLVESVSPHGMDNLTILVVVSGVARGCVG